MKELFVHDYRAQGMTVNWKRAQELHKKMGKKKILFVYPNLVQSENISLGIAYLSAALKKAGHKTSLFDMTFNQDKYQLQEKIEHMRPDYVAFSTRSGEYNTCCELAIYIRNQPSIRDTIIIIGGPHITAVGIPQKYSCLFHVWFQGEADISLVDWVNAPKLPFAFNLIGELPPKNLEKLPYPDYDLFDIQRYINTTGGLEVISSRGCPYSCTYCINGTPNAPKFRQKSPEYFVNELIYLANKYTVTKFFFQDDMFAAKEEWIDNFTDLMRHTGFTFSCNVRPERMTNRITSLLATAGCTSVNIGIETGNAYLRHDLLGRKVKDDVIIRAFKNAKHYGLKTYAYNILGLPNESKVAVKETLQLNKQIQPDHLQVSIFQPYPGTKLHDYLIAHDKNISYSDSHQSLSKYCYAEYGKLYLRWLKVTFRFRVLWKQYPKKAMMLLFYDTFRPILNKLRRFTPVRIKTLFLNIVRS